MFTKKMLLLILVLSMILAFVGCVKEGEVPASESSEAEDQLSEFAEPENYATVMLVAINPKIRLYLDSDGIVLALEAVNKDAEKIKESISFENNSYETVVENILTKSQEKGYIKNNSVINIEIIKAKDTSADTSAILDKVTITVKETAARLNLKIKIKTKDKDDDKRPDVDVDGSTEETATAPDTPTQCSHAYENATCTAPKTCTKCGATEGITLEHTYQNGECSCGARQLGVGLWSAVVLNDKYSLKVKLDFNCSEASKGQLIDIETAKEVCPEDAPKITYNGVTYVHWFFEGCICFYECTEDTVTVYMGTKDKKENWPNTFVLKRISATEIAVTEAFGESQTYFGLQPGCVFTYIPE